MPSLPTATHSSTKPLQLSPQLSKQMYTHTRTHSFIQTHAHRNTLIQPQSLLEGEREGDASKGSVWKVAGTSPPHPTHLRLP